MAVHTSSRFADAHVGRAIVAVCSVFLGFGLVLAVGFARVDAIHSAAHDTRHSASFPCH